MADERFPFLSFILGFISNLTACFQANLADYSRRRQNIIRLLSLPVSRGGRLDLPLVWLCFCPDFDILNCFCDFEESNVTTIQTHTKEIQRWRQFIISRAHNSEQVCVKHPQSGKLSFSNRFMVYVRMGENDAKTQRVDANFFENGLKKLRFQTNRDTWGQCLNEIRKTNHYANFGVDVWANMPQRQRKHLTQKNYYFDIAAANTY